MLAKLLYSSKQEF